MEMLGMVPSDVIIGTVVGRCCYCCCFVFVFVFVFFFCLIDPHFKLCQTGEEQAKGVDLIDITPPKVGILEL